ncbi:MAG: glycosyltransferase family 39 protein [Anaerolineae bacterium]|nr:MAG: glycosyltransferase family 39 protein [Anaerolineae bacterium]
MNRRTLAWVSAVAGLVLWLFFVYATFYWAQKPFSGQNALAVARTIRDLAVAALVVGLGAALGHRLWRLFSDQVQVTFDLLLYQVGLGLALLALVTLALGLAGLLYRGVFWGLTAALCGLLFRDLCAVTRAMLDLGRSLRLSRWLAAFLAVTGLLALLVALAPPIDWDGLFYHLTGPKWHIARHRIVPGYDLPHLNFPGLVEMLFTYAMLLSSDVTAKLLNFVYGLVLVGLTYRIGQRHLAPHLGQGAALILTSMPMLPVLAGWAYNDLALTFYQMAALSALMDWLAERRRRWLILSAVNCGLALSVKYTGFVCPLVILALLIWLALRDRQGGGAVWRATITFGLVTVLVAGPWYLKSWFFMGNPVYPFLFGGRFWDGFRDTWYAQAGTGIGADLTQWITLPWVTTLGFRDMNYYDGRMGPLMLGFLPLLALYAWRRRRGTAPRPLSSVLPLGAFAVAHCAFWMVGVISSRSLWQSRLLLPAFAAMSPLLALALDDLRHLDRPVFSLHRFFQMTIVIVLALNVVCQGLDVLRVDPLPYLVGLETEPEFLRRNLGAHYRAMEIIAADLPSDARVRFLWEPRSYYCQRDCQPDSILDAFPHLVHRYGSADAIAQAWQQEGVTHVLIFRAGLGFVLNESPGMVNTAVLAELENGYLQEVFDVAGAYQLYALE